MENERALNAKILTVTKKIQEQYPEIYDILNEMPVTIPDTKAPEINTKILKDYYESLVLLLNKYSAAQK